jgi:hypothetical protein
VPVEPIMEQAHRPEWVVADAGFENDPVCNRVEPVFPIERGDVGVIQGVWSAASAPRGRDRPS